MSDEQTDGRPMVVVTALPTTKAGPDRFTGDVWVDSLTGDGGPGYARLAMVRFSPGARTAWHCHARGQTLHVTEGVGLVQSRGVQTVLTRPRDTVFIPPAVWRWYGATPDCFMCHLALADSGTEAGVADVEWGDHESDDENAGVTTGGVTEGNER
jgi:quercetin dioxygenase-like cupin family protein